MEVRVEGNDRRVNRAIGTRQFGPLHGLSLGLQILSMLIVLAGLVAALRRPA